MTLIEILSLFATMVVLAAIPSSSVALVIGRSMTHGVPHGIAVSAGIVLGDLIFIALVMLGLVALADAMGSMFMIVKYLGACYLLWLGLSLLRAKPSFPEQVGQSQRGSFTASFLAGLLLTLGDLKAIFFYLSLLPMFINLEALRLVDTVIIVMVTIFAVGGTKMFYAFCAHCFMSSLNKGKLFTSFSSKAAGVTLIGAGSYLIIKT